MEAGDVLDVAFLCDGYIVAHASGPDLAIFAEASAEGIVDVSQDGSVFQTVGILAADAGSPQTFSLATVRIDQAQFVRVTARGSLAIDAVQAL
jgi:hypothetical protein